MWKSMFFSASVAACALSAVGCASTGPAPTAVVTASAADWVAVTSAHDVATTVKRLETTIAERGAVHFATIDHAAGAASVGAPLSPMTLVIFGNPKVGSKLMAADPTVGSELPLRILVFTDTTGQTRIGFQSPLTLAVRYDLQGVSEVLVAMDKSMRTLAAAAAAAE